MGWKTGEYWSVRVFLNNSVENRRLSSWDHIFLIHSLSLSTYANTFTFNVIIYGITLCSRVYKFTLVWVLRLNIVVTKFNF